MEHKVQRDIELVHDAMHERGQIARYLRALADGLEKGQLRLSSGEHSLELHPASLCTFELRTASERQRVKIHLMLGWREADLGATADALEISSG